jgi:prepilin-type N-terminal cleavage/methylation domain-containing protein/prepilin-type processing-associated H-X9-DG protein
MNDRFYPRTLQHRAFTLVELLVVIGIIAVLISLILPALRVAHDQAQNVQCANNLRQLGIAATNYASSNDGVLPITAENVNPPEGNWLWDMPVEITARLERAGAPRNAFYCPFSADRQDVDGLWNFDRLFRVTGYMWLTDRSTWVIVNSLKPNEKIQTKTVKVKMMDKPANAEDSELAVDDTLSQNGNFGSIMGGWYLPHITSHLRNGKPIGGNIVYLDGHVAWRPFSDMRARCAAGNIQFWF